MRGKCQHPCDPRLGAQPASKRDVGTGQHHHPDHDAGDQPPGARAFKPGGTEELQQHECRAEGDGKQKPLRARQVSHTGKRNRQHEPRRPAVAQEANRRPQAERPGKQECAFREHIHHHIARERIDDHQQASQPRRCFAVKLERQQVDRNNEQNGRAKRKQDRGPLPGDRAAVAHELVRCRHGKRMNRVICPAQGRLMPRAGVDPLGLMNVAEAVGKAGLGMVHTPREQTRRKRHQHRNSNCMSPYRPGVPSTREIRDRAQGSHP